MSRTANYMRTRSLGKSAHVARVLLNQRDDAARQTHHNQTPPTLTFQAPKNLGSGALELGARFSGDEFSGCYVLLDKDDRIQYVGTSNCVVTRIRSHRKKGLIPFEDASYWLMEDDTRSRAEHLLINLFNPPYNKTGYYGSHTKPKQIQKAADWLLEHGIKISVNKDEGG